MEHKEIVIKVTSSESSPVIKMVIEIERSGQDMKNKTEQSIQNLLGPEGKNVYEMLGEKQAIQVTKTHHYIFPQKNFLWDK